MSGHTIHHCPCAGHVEGQEPSQPAQPTAVQGEISGQVPQKKQTVSILVPCYNEAEVLPLLQARLQAVMDSLPHYAWEVVAINDGSTDKTLEVLRDIRRRDKRFNYIDLSRNFGKEPAMMAGLDFCESDAVIILDADLQDPPELITQMLERWQEGYDDVYARRSSREGESATKRWTSKLFYKLLQRVAHIPVQQDSGDFRLLDRRCVLALRQLRERERYTKGLFSWIGFNKTEIVFDRQPRAAGKTKFSYPSLISLAIKGLTSFTVAPLRLISITGALVSLFAFLFTIYIVIDTLIFGNNVDGYPSTVVFILFLGGLQLLSIGVVGEYVATIYQESKNRPVYLVAEHNGARVSVPTLRSGDLPR